MKLGRKFYNRDTLVIAEELLGKILVHKTNGKVMKGIIVETEGYLGVNDKAAHSYGGKRTKRVETMYGFPGTSYVYMIYGMYYCFNVVTREEGVPEAVLIRSIEPIEGIDEMARNRFGKKVEELSKYQRKNLTNGPGKLCMAFNIDKSLDKEDLCGDYFYIEEGINRNFNIVKGKRIGIDYAEEAKDYLYRFYIKENPYVSKKNS